MNFLAAARVTASYLVICAAVERAMRRTSPSPAKLRYEAHGLRPSRVDCSPGEKQIPYESITKIALQARDSAEARMNPRRSSGNANRAILSATIMSQARASSSPPQDKRHERQRW